MITKFLQICLTSKCNRSCDHCPMGKWRNTDDPKYHLTNDVLIPFIQKNISSEDWLIELTGGEPTLYEGISELLDWLSEHGYTVHIRTNGIIPVHPRPNLTRIVAFHDLKKPPEVFDVVLIVDKLDHREKIKYCEEHHYPYVVIGYWKEQYDDLVHHFKEISVIEPSCHSLPCPCGKAKIELVMDEKGQLYDKNRLEYCELSKTECCKHCKAAIDAWRFLKWSRVV